MIYASTACLGAPELWAALNAYERAGIDAVELGNCTLDTLDGLEARLVEQDASYVVHNYFPPPRDPFVLNLASPDEDVRRRSLEHVTAALDLAAAVGSSIYSVHAGFVCDPVGTAGGRFEIPTPSSPDATPAALDRFTASIESALSHAALRQVRLLVENNVCVPEHRGKLLLQSADELETFLARFDSPSLGLLLDTGHLTVTATTLGFDADDFVDRVTPWIGAFHVHDNDGLADRHLPVAADGWTASVLRRPELAGLPVTVEARFETPEAVASQVRALRSVLDGQ